MTGASTTTRCGWRKFQIRGPIRIYLRRHARDQIHYLRLKWELPQGLASPHFSYSVPIAHQAKPSTRTSTTAQDIFVDEQRLAATAKGDEPCRLVFDRQKLVRAQTGEVEETTAVESFLGTLSGVRHKLAQ